MKACAITAALLLVLLSACGGGDPEPEPEPPTCSAEHPELCTWPPEVR